MPGRSRTFPPCGGLDSGAVAEVDAILRALVLLEDLAPGRREDCERLPPSGRRRGVISRLLRRAGPASGANDNMTTLRQPRQVSEFRFVPNLCRRPMARVLIGRLS